MSISSSSLNAIAALYAIRRAYLLLGVLCAVSKKDIHRLNPYHVLGRYIQFLAKHCAPL